MSAELVPRFIVPEQRRRGADRYSDV